jgi:hypothetical protein
MTDRVGVGILPRRSFRSSRAEIADGRVAAGRVVEGLDPGEHRSTEPGSGRPVVPVEELALPRRTLRGVADEPPPRALER